MRFILTGFLFLVSSISISAKDFMRIEISGQVEGVVEIELLSDLAPNHVIQIKKLVSEKNYDGVAFHRVIEGFMAQTGDVVFGNVFNEYR